MWEQIPGVASLKGILPLFAHESSATVDGFRNPAIYHQLTCSTCSPFFIGFSSTNRWFSHHQTAIFHPIPKGGRRLVPLWQVDSPPSTEAQGSRWG